MCRYGTRRAEPSTGDGPRITDDQYREWQRWIVEGLVSADYGVVPVDYLVEQVADREPEAIDRSTIRSALTGTVLPRLEREPAFDYDADREQLVTYR